MERCHFQRPSTAQGINVLPTARSLSGELDLGHKQAFGVCNIPFLHVSARLPNMYLRVTLESVQLILQALPTMGSWSMGCFPPLALRGEDAGRD